MIAAKAVMGSLLEHAADVEFLAVLSRFRVDFHACLTARADELSELADAALCADCPVRDLAGLSLAPEHRRGHGALYDAVNVANSGALEWHAWTSCTDQPYLPTYALIDIDPGPATSWDDVLVLARLHRIALGHLGVTGRPKLTGRRGIQIWIPIARGPTFAETRNWTKQLSRAVGAAVPELVSREWSVRDRGGLARLDHTQNVINKTLVAPYSPRAAAGAPVSAPIDWDEVDDPVLRPGSFTIRDFPRWLAERGDLFRAVLTARQLLAPIP